ncbi:P-loop containing nucleoside triphosphate hydrolase protein [Zopfochytrium polystomum]|nr:P-loop containing nucleoside triphosphate hydrolase protein [Zopfochytrium polystomum]
MQPRATAVQALAIPASLNPTRDGRALVVGAETGSGKTLAYLIPMLQRLKEEEDAEATRAIAANDVVEAVVTQMITVGGGSSDVPTASDATVRALASSRLRKLRRPRAIVLVPTRELVTQVLDVAKRLCGHSHGGGARLAVVGMHARPADPKRLRERLGAAPIDVLITTPSALRKRVDAGELLLGRVTEVVVDEADTLMDEGFTTELDDVLLPMWEAAAAREAKMNAAPPLITYVTATLPLSMTRRITKVHPTHSTVVTPSLHRTLPRLHQRFLRVAPGGAPVKNQLLLEVVKRAATSGDRRMIVFCNTRESAAAVHSLLRRQTATEGGGDGGGGGGTLGELNSMATQRRRPLARTRSMGRKDSSRGEAEEEEAEDEEASDADVVRILVATDVASRGLDTGAADHVVLYDFPLTAIDYLHRVGRTARNGRPGRATSLVGTRDAKLAESIERAVSKGAVLA